MSHWYTHDRLASERRADLDREADRVALMRRARRDEGSPSWRRRIGRALVAARRRRLELELRFARRHVAVLERALQTLGTD
jgi:hypothetical protein